MREKIKSKVKTLYINIDIINKGRRFVPLEDYIYIEKENKVIKIGDPENN